MKTGYTVAAGYNVVTSAVHSDTRLIGVVIGAANGSERDTHMAMLLDQGFDRMGVPPVPSPYLVSRRDPGPRIPSLIGTAHAAPISPGAVVRPPPFARASAPAPHRLPAIRPDRAPRYAYGADPVQLRPAYAQVPAMRPSNPTRTAHGPAYWRYPG